MKVKIVTDYVDMGCGFPVILNEAALGVYKGNEITLFDYSEIDEKVLVAVATLPCRLTGNHIRFIRAHAQDTYVVFGQRFDVSHAAVIAWEKFKDEPTNMNLGTEAMIRAYALILAGASKEKIGEVLTDFVLHREDAGATKHVPVRISINTDPSSFCAKPEPEITRIARPS